MTPYNCKPGKPLKTLVKIERILRAGPIPTHSSAVKMADWLREIIEAEKAHNAEAA